MIPFPDWQNCHISAGSCRDPPLSDGEFCARSRNQPPAWRRRQRPRAPAWGQSRRHPGQGLDRRRAARHPTAPDEYGLSGIFGLCNPDSWIARPRSFAAVTIISEVINPYRTSSLGYSPAHRYRAPAGRNDRRRNPAAQSPRAPPPGTRLRAHDIRGGVAYLQRREEGPAHTIRTCRPCAVSTGSTGSVVGGAPGR